MQLTMGVTVREELQVGSVGKTLRREHIQFMISRMREQRKQSKKRRRNGRIQGNRISAGKHATKEDTGLRVDMSTSTLFSRAQVTCPVVTMRPASNPCSTPSTSILHKTCINCLRFMKFSCIESFRLILYLRHVFHSFDT